MVSEGTVLAELRAEVDQACRAAIERHGIGVASDELAKVLKIIDRRAAAAGSAPAEREGLLEFDGLHRGQIVTVNHTDDAWEYGGCMQFGGVIERFWPDDTESGQVEVSFFGLSEDGWGWNRWQFQREAVQVVPLTPYGSLAATEAPDA